nr:uncharacterized protein LOC108019916 [Drosophila suzukii]
MGVRSFSIGYSYKIRKSECIANAAYFSNVSCVLKPINWTRSVMNMDCDIKDILTDIKMTVEVFYKDSSNLYKPFAVKFSFDICQLLKNKTKRFLLEKYAMNHLEKWTNVNHSCPFTGHLFAREFHLDEVSLPTLPFQDYKIAFNFSGDKPSKHLGLVFIYFEVLQDYYKNKRTKPRPK